MVSLLFWQWSVLGVLSRYDSPIVIERPPNRVDVFLTVNAAGLFGEVLRTSITMEQTWTDPRLSFQGVSEVPLPNNVLSWHPDTVVLNSLSSENKLMSSFLNFDGKIRRRQLLLVEVLCDESLNNETNPNIFECPLQLTSFSNRGCDQITYAIEKIDINRVARISNATVIEDFFDSHLNQTSHMATVVLYLQKPHRFHHGVRDKGM
ncbi:unnamed protein product [Angiostrongylus costaricensis]|uniref:Neur_chan_LBD domain-containing protein n=1 Tax=Angiostrongylus costaricensis TaxID=334426 RepID=A0A0R3PEU1_ANGCS|nr:unnamed protein product [Angiostrongylus costaricensis]